MVADALKGYIQLANGLTDVTKDKCLCSRQVAGRAEP